MGSSALGFTIALIPVETDIVKLFAVKLNPLSQHYWLTLKPTSTIHLHMSPTLDETASTDHTRRHMTTLLLEDRDDQWVVTQGGVDAEGTGPTAVAAAADYCRQLDDADE